MDKRRALFQGLHYYSDRREIEARTSRLRQIVCRDEKRNELEKMDRGSASRINAEIVMAGVHLREPAARKKEKTMTTLRFNIKIEGIDDFDCFGGALKQGFDGDFLNAKRKGKLWVLYCFGNIVVWLETEEKIFLPDGTVMILVGGKWYKANYDLRSDRARFFQVHEWDKERAVGIIAGEEFRKSKNSRSIARVVRAAQGS